MSTNQLPTSLPPLDRQAERLIGLGVHELAGLSSDELRDAARADTADGAQLVVHPGRVPASALTPLPCRP